MSDKEKRPHRTSMEGMIWNANHTLEYALRPGIRGVPKSYFMECAGIAILSSVDAGFIFSGTVGTGILMAHMTDGSWSNPIACGLTGVGFGLLAGIAAKEMIVFFPDAASIKTFLSAGVHLGGKSDVTIGVGREFDGTFGVSKTGFSSVLTYAYTKGAFAAASLDTEVVAPRKAVNMMFYGEKVDDLMDIIQNKVKFPYETKHTLWPEVQEKLKKLAEGVSEMPNDAEKEKKEAARVAADEAAEELRQSNKEDIIELTCIVDREDIVDSSVAVTEASSAVSSAVVTEASSSAVVTEASSAVTDEAVKESAKE